MGFIRSHCEATGVSYNMNGTATTTIIGAASVTGSLQGVEFIAKGYAHGSLTFTNAHGTVTIKLTGLREQSGFAPLPSYFRYVVTNATGDYRHLQEHGTIRIDLHSHPQIMGNTQGTFRFVV